MPRVSVILNPHAGRGRGAKVHSLIKEAIPEASVLQTRFAGEAEALACQAARDGADIVVAAGGDGTLCEVLNGIWPHRKRLKLAVLPIGTGNDFARTLGIGTDFPKAIEVIRAGHCQRVDVGRVAIGEGEKQSQFFINVCGTGFDALVATRINSASSHPVLRYLKGTVAYLWAVLSELIRLQSRELTICIDGQVICEKAVLCAIANAKSYGGGMLVAPNAELGDGLLDIVIIGDVNSFQFLRAFPTVFSGKHLQHPQVQMFRGKEISISSPILEGQKALNVLVDGENLGSLPIKFNILPHAVEFLVPKS